MSIKTSLILFCASMVFLNLIFSCSQTKTDETTLEQVNEAETLAVEIVTVKRVPVEREEVTQSFLYAKKDAFVLAKVEGVLKEVHVDLGEEVKEGDTLAKIEDELLHLEFKLAKNSFDQIRQDFERYQTLYDKKLISESEFEKMKLKCEQADIEQQWAHERFRQTRLIAPFSGVLVSNFARIGQAVKAGDSLFHVTESFPVYTRVFLNEEQLSRVRTEGKVRLRPRYGAEKSAWGKIIKKSPIVNPASGTVELVIRIDDQYTFMKPGMTVNVFLKPAVPSVSLAVSKRAFSNPEAFSFRDTASIYLYKDGRALKRVVELRENLDSLWGIGGGLNLGDSVIISGHSDLKDGQKVKISLTPSSQER